MRTRSMPIHTLVCGSQERATPHSRTMRYTVDSKGECTSLEVGVVFWRTTKYMATHWLGFRSERGATLSSEIMRFIMVSMEAFMW